MLLRHLLMSPLLHLPQLVLLRHLRPLLLLRHLLLSLVLHLPHLVLLSLAHHHQVISNLLCMCQLGRTRSSW